MSKCLLLTFGIRILFVNPRKAIHYGRINFLPSDFENFFRFCVAHGSTLHLLLLFQLYRNEGEKITRNIILLM